MKVINVMKFEISEPTDLCDSIETSVFRNNNKKISEPITVTASD